MSARALFFASNGQGPFAVIKSKTTANRWFVVDTRTLKIVIRCNDGWSTMEDARRLNARHNGMPWSW